MGEIAGNHEVAQYGNTNVEIGGTVLRIDRRRYVARATHGAASQACSQLACDARQVSNGVTNIEAMRQPDFVFTKTPPHRMGIVDGC